jgi:predicted GNAT family N-acyltransferase
MVGQRTYVDIILSWSSGLGITLGHRALSIGKTERGSALTEHPVGVRVELVSWIEAEPAIRAIREAVFIVEQGVPEELEWDGLDPSSTHVLARNNRGEAIGTARMQPEGKIGRMAVLRNWRGRGVGRALLQKLLDLAVQQRLMRAMLAAQIHALGFYERAGFQAIGEPFMDAGIPHRIMVKELLLPEDIMR